ISGRKPAKWPISINGESTLAAFGCCRLLRTGVDSWSAGIARRWKAQLRPQLGQPALGLGVHGRPLDLEHPAHDRCALELRCTECSCVASLDLGADLVERGHVLAHGL